jgi:hypothetical protein
MHWLDLATVVLDVVPFIFIKTLHLENFSCNTGVVDGGG